MVHILSQFILNLFTLTLILSSLKSLFSNNNLWISLPAVQRVIEEGTLDMEVIVNPKVLEGGVNVIQLEVLKLFTVFRDCTNKSLIEFE